MSDLPTAFPLSWPRGWTRTPQSMRVLRIAARPLNCHEIAAYTGNENGLTTIRLEQVQVARRMKELLDVGLVHAAPHRDAVSGGSLHGRARTVPVRDVARLAPRLAGGRGRQRRVHRMGQHANRGA